MEPQVNVGTPGALGETGVTGSPDARKAWHTAFAKAQADLDTVDATVKVDTGSFGYAYAPLAVVIAAVRKALAANGLSFSQDVTAADRMILVTTRIYHEDGWVEVFGPLPLAAGGTNQQTGGSITYARRYALSAALGVAADEDNDGADEPKPNQSQQQPAQPRKVGPMARSGAERVVALLQSTEGVKEDTAKEAVKAVIAESEWEWADLAQLPIQEQVLADARNWLTRQTADEAQAPLL